jgi:hypothetical protein
MQAEGAERQAVRGNHQTTFIYGVSSTVATLPERGIRKKYCIIAHPHTAANLKDLKSNEAASASEQSRNARFYARYARLAKLNTT